MHVDHHLDLSPDESAPRHKERTFVALGDSIVAGWGVEHSESYVALIRRWLNEQAPRQSWQVINAGVPGDTVVMGAERYDRDVAPFAPDVLLLAFGLNDGALRRTQFDAQREQLWRATHHLAGRAALIAKGWAKAALKRVFGDELLARAVRRQAIPRVEPALFLRALGDLADRAGQAGAQVLIAPLAPVASPALATVAQMRLSSEQWESYLRYNALLLELARCEGLSLVDLSSDPQPERPETMLVDDGVHMTASGQFWLATRVYSALKGMIQIYAQQDIDR